MDGKRGTFFVAKECWGGLYLETIISRVAAFTRTFLIRNDIDVVRETDPVVTKY